MVLEQASRYASRTPRQGSMGSNGLPWLFCLSAIPASSQHPILGTTVLTHESSHVRFSQIDSHIRYTRDSSDDRTMPQAALLWTACATAPTLLDPVRLRLR